MKTFLKPFRSLLAVGVLLTLIFNSCRRDDDQASWEVDLLTPLVRSSMGIESLLTDTLLESNPDSSLKLVYQSHLYNLTLDTLVQLPDTSVIRSYTLDSISLYDQSIVYPVTLGQICMGAGIIGAVIISQNGNTLAIPAIPSLSSTPYPIDADTLFQTMTLLTGFLDISIQNDLPIDITNLTIEIRNNSNSFLVASATFPIIAVGTTQTQTISLAGITIEGALTGQIISMGSNGSNGVPVAIDTSDALLSTLTVYDLHPSSATAIFPSQNLIDKEKTVPFKFKTVELVEAHVKSGQAVIELYSTLQDSVRFTYKLPSASLNGVPFEISTTLAPAPPSGVTVFTQSYDFTGFDLDLTGPNFDTVNTIYNRIQARVDSTGQMKTLSITDSIYSSMRFENIIPDYARGYLGQDTFTAGPSQEMISIFNRIIDGTIQVEDVKLDVQVRNGIGAEAQVDINQLTSVNTRTGTAVTLSGPVLSGPVTIARATDAGGNLPVTESTTQLLINNSNSNANAFIENLPDRIDYALTLRTNPNGNTANYNDFIYADHLMEIDLNVEMPLSLIANNLTLCDTADIDLGSNDLSKITGGYLHLIADNGFPFNTRIQMYTLSSTGAVTDSLLGNNLVVAGPVDANGRVYEKKRTRITIPVDTRRLDALQNAVKIRIISRFDTSPGNTLLKIYSDYKIDFLITGDFNYIR
jgi:hypothetical protein